MVKRLIMHLFFLLTIISFFSICLLFCNSEINREENEGTCQIDERKMQQKKLLSDIKAEFDKLYRQCIMPAEGFIKYDYLIPGGFYKQMWDWDGFFIGCYLLSRSEEDSKYLKWWVINFVKAIDNDGYVAGCIAINGPRPIFGKFAMKPFLTQGAYLYSKETEEFSWIAPIYNDLKKVIAYREKTQFDPGYNLFFWDNAMQSGADNNVVLTNDENDRSAILATDINTFQLREYISMAKIADRLGRTEDSIMYYKKAENTKIAMLKYLWFEEDKSFFNIRRDTAKPLKRISYSNFIPLIQKIIPEKKGIKMIKKYLWNREHMLADYGLRTLSKQDNDYNNKNIIIPYSNWQGPVWPIANYLYFICLKNYGFDHEAAELASLLGNLVLKDIKECGSTHENYHADTGEPLAPTAEQSKDGIFKGFVGWNLLIQNMLEGVVEDKWLLFEL